MSRFEFSVEEDIRRASTLPAWVYSDPEFYARAKHQVFERSWQLVADTDRLRAPGAVLPLALLEGCLDEPLVLTRDRADRLHCMSNVCTHRGTLVVESEGVAQGLRCRYHGRRFGLDGGFEFMPEFEGAADFPSRRDDLPQVEFGTFGKFMFCSLAPPCALEAGRSRRAQPTGTTS